jgi:hypothetical protein
MRSGVEISILDVMSAFKKLQILQARAAQHIFAFKSKFDQKTYIR